MTFKRGFQVQWRAISLGLVLLPLGALPARAESYIRLLYPSKFVVAERRSSIQGRVETPRITRVVVDVEPFVSKQTPAFQREYTLSVREGYFQGDMDLFPGLNVVTVRTSGEGVSECFGFFQPEGALHQSEPHIWGASTPVVIAEPRSLRMTSPKVMVGGVVTDPRVTHVDLLVLTARHFLAIQGETASEERGVPIVRLPVKGLRFQGPVTLDPGHNILLTRPLPGPVGEEQIEIKSLIYDETSPNIAWDLPVPFTGGIRINGQIKNDHSSASPTLALNALGRSRPKGPLENRTLFAGVVKTDAKGQFLVIVPPLPDNFEIKDFPVCTLTLGKERATQTLLHWRLGDTTDHSSPTPRTP